MDKVELHTCSNCEVIDRIVIKKTEWFDAISKENIKLHKLLMQEIKNKEDLLSKISFCNDIIIAERSQYLSLHLEHNSQNKTTKNYSSTSGEDIGILKCQIEKYLEQIELLQSHNEYMKTNYKAKFNHYQLYCEMLLEMLDVYRHELFKQRKINNEEHKKFSSTVKFITDQNNRELISLQDEHDSILRKQLTGQAHGEYATDRHEIVKNKQLIQLLRNQIRIMELQINDLKDDNKELITSHAQQVSSLKTDINTATSMYKKAECRRRLEAEGFKVDIDQLKKQLANSKE